MTHDIVFEIEHPLSKISFGTVTLIDDHFINFIDSEEIFNIYDIINGQ